MPLILTRFDPGHPMPLILMRQQHATATPSEPIIPPLRSCAE